MNKNDLYKDILLKLKDYLTSQGIITAVEEADVQDDLDWTRNLDACDKLMACANIGPYKKAVQYIKDGLSDRDDLTVALPLRHRTASPDNRKRLADFHVRSNTLVVITAKAIREMATSGIAPLADSKCHEVIEMIWLVNKDTPAELSYLWEIYNGQHADDYFIFTNELDNENSDWRLYAYAYFCFVNEHHYKKPAVLNFTAGKEFVTSIPYQAGNKYEQYFDAYNVMSESLFADDVLQRYLRMYQILEYFGYRKILADLTKGNIRENGFVRNVISKASGRGGNELNEIKSGVGVLIPHLATTARNAGVFAVGDIDAAMESFIKDKLLLSSYTFSDDNLWQVIYKLRNCIVHNKESDLHFTYSNTDAYVDGISLMKKIIEKMEPEIVNIINNPAITAVEFDRQYEAVY